MVVSKRDELTRILREVSAGSQQGLDTLFDACYRELRLRARRYLAHEAGKRTIQTTDLVHDVYLRLVDSAHLEWRDRAHFMALAARAMRHLLVDRARSRRSSKRDGNWQRISLNEMVIPMTRGRDTRNHELLDLDRALSGFQEAEPEKARVVEMKFFAGMSDAEIGAVMGVSERTVRRHLTYAQVRLYKALTSDAP